MKKQQIIIIVLIAVLFLACTRNYNGLNSPIVINSIDSILKANTHIGPFGKSETFWEDEYGPSGRRTQWIYTDSIEKYCSKDEIIELYKHNESPVIRMVAFHILLKKSPKDAIRFAIEDMEEDDSLLCGRNDEALLESCSSIRTRMIQQWPKKYDISAEDSLIIDSVVMNSKNKDSNWYYLLHLKQINLRQSTQRHSM